MMHMRAVIYARYSSDLQRAASIEDQVRICRARADHEGWTVVGVFSDAAISGATLIRPGLQTLMQAIRSGGVDIVLTESLDRISRDQEHIAAFYKQASFARVRIVTLAEGDISELHIGLKGTMGALYLKDLAQKTRRGIEGRIRAGRSIGKPAYGYRLVRRLSSDGEPERGLREIAPEQAVVVRRIFEAYVGGLSPRRIATMLNKDGIPGPSGGVWYDASIRGRPEHGDGLLRNSTYAGVLTWCRRSNTKHPVDGRIVRHRNAPGDVVTVDVPELRIIDECLWEKVQARLIAESVAPRRSTEAQPSSAFWQRRRPRHLLTSKVFCGCCGRSFGAVGQDYLGCQAGRNGGCRNTTLMRRSRLEQLVLDALGSQLMQPELVAEFIRAFNAEWARLCTSIVAAANARRKELPVLSRKIDNLVDAISEGDRSPSLRDKLALLEAQRNKLMSEATASEVPLPALHPGIADIYRRKVANLHEAISSADDHEVLEAVRALIEKVIVTPPDHDADPPGIELIGDLTELLRAAGLGPALQGSPTSTTAVLDTFASSVKDGPGGSAPWPYFSARRTLTVAPASSTAAIAAIGQIACSATAAGMSCRNTPRATTSIQRTGSSRLSHSTASGMFSTGEAKPDSTIAGAA
jgi:site-specific DNA recombinase